MVAGAATFGLYLVLWLLCVVFMQGEWLGWFAGPIGYGAPILAITVDGAVRRATFGMRMTWLQIGGRSGRRIGFWCCLGRILLGFALLPLLPVSAVVSLIDRRGRTLADLICGTCVWASPRLPTALEPRGFHVMPLEDRQHL